MFSAVLSLALAPSPAGVFGREKPLPPVTVPAEAPYGYTYCPARDLDLVARYPAQRTPVVGVAVKGKERPPVADGVMLPPPELPSRTRRFRR